MTRIKNLAGLVIAVCALASPVHAAEGVLIVERTTSGDGTRSNQIRLEPQRMRVDVTDAGGRAQVVIFDGGKQVLSIIDSSRKSYTEMTKADADRLGGQLSAAMTAMQEQLKNLPPAQRAQFEAMMKGRGLPSGAAARPTEYRRAGNDTVGTWTCAKYEGFQDNDKTSEICTVEPKDLGFTPADFEVSRQLMEFFGSLIPRNVEVFAVGTPEKQGFSGVPVRRVTQLGPRPTISEIVEIKRDTFPESLFVVPDGFTRQALPGPAGR